MRSVRREPGVGYNALDETAAHMAVRGLDGTPQAVGSSRNRIETGPVWCKLPPSGSAPRTLGLGPECVSLVAVRSIAERPRSDRVRPGRGSGHVARKAAGGSRVRKVGQRFMEALERLGRSRTARPPRPPDASASPAHKPGREWGQCPSCAAAAPANLLPPPPAARSPWTPARGRREVSGNAPDSRPGNGWPTIRSSGCAESPRGTDSQRVPQAEANQANARPESTIHA